MRILFIISMLFISSLVSAGEGHRWVKLGYESKAMIVAMYENGLSQGCVNGVALATEQLFSDPDMQSQQAVKIILKCPTKVVSTSQEMAKVIGAVDQAYSSPGAASIPIGIVVQAALKAINNGQSAIDDAELKDWISVSSKL